MDGVSRSRPARRKTIWEEGHTPGRLVRTVTATVLLAVALLDTLLLGRLTWLFDITFVLTCIGAALMVRPRDYFMIGVLPPLAMLTIVVVLAAFERTAVADADDGLVQATVSGLAHHAGALVVGYTLTLAILVLRQLAARNAGAIRSAARPTTRLSARHVAPASSGADNSAGDQPREAALMSRRSSGGSAKMSDSSAECTARASG